MITMTTSELDQAQEFIQQIAEDTPEPIDTSTLQTITLQEVAAILGKTIKKDEDNKIVAFLCQLSAYTETSQFNVSFNAPSSSGKSYIPLEVSKFFPPEDVMKLGNVSPTAFFHEHGDYDRTANTVTIDLERKIIVFTDQPHYELLVRLRSLLSHDEKIITSKITDKSERGGNRTKTVNLVGFPAVIFCTAGLSIDEQEATRFLLLSPEVNQEKIREGVWEKLKKGANAENYNRELAEDSERQGLIRRIQAIKQAHIMDVKIPNIREIYERFILITSGHLKPRHQRDIQRLLSLIQVIALLNFWLRDYNGTSITVSQEDINAAFDLWSRIAVSQELNIPPYIHNLYLEVIVPQWQEKNRTTQGLHSLEGSQGITYREIVTKHYAVYNRMCDLNLLRTILHLLETAGLITREKDAQDKRQMLVIPAVLPSSQDEQNNSAGEGGVQEDQITHTGMLDWADEVFSGDHLENTRHLLPD